MNGGENIIKFLICGHHIGLQDDDALDQTNLGNATNAFLSIPRDFQMGKESAGQVIVILIIQCLCCHLQNDWWPITMSTFALVTDNVIML